MEENNFAIWKINGCDRFNYGHIQHIKDEEVVFIGSFEEVEKTFNEKYESLGITIKNELEIVYAIVEKIITENTYFSNKIVSLVDLIEYCKEKNLNFKEQDIHNICKRATFFVKVTNENDELIALTTSL